MTRRPRQLRSRHEVSIHHILQLASGFDFFGFGFGEGPEAIDAMRDAWQSPEVRAAVYEYRRRRNDDRVPWAAEFFDSAN